MSRAWIRRPITIGGIGLLAVVLLITIPVWVVIAALVDLVSRRWRFPTVRLLAFALLWSWLEMAGVVGAATTWLVGRAHHMPTQYALQRWWAASIMRSLRIACGLRVEVSGAGSIPDGPVVCLVRHASLGDALVSAWILGSLSHRFPRYVMKKELLLDPCLDIVGQRIPNWFVDRGSVAIRQEMSGIRGMAEDMGPRDVAVIFPEGTRSTDEKRTALVARLERRAPDRHGRLTALRHLLPPRLAGVQTLLDSVPEASVVLMRHVGFDGLDSLRGIHRAMGQGRTRARVVLEWVPGDQVPRGGELGDWLDHQWLRMDSQVAEEQAAL